MDSVFGIGAPELILILLLAGIVMGPHRIRNVALWLGRVTAQLQAISRGFVRQLNAELATVDDDGEIRDALKEMQELRRQVKELRREITTSALKPVQESAEILNESKELVERSIKPPTLTAQNETLSPTADNVPNAEAPAEDSPLPKLIEVPDDPES
ncbi:MAG: hypothetical protein ACE5E7_12570 [Anaerolineae bacterium]